MSEHFPISPQFNKKESANANSKNHSGSNPQGNSSEGGSKLLSTNPPPIPSEIVLFAVKEKPVFPGMFMPLGFTAESYEPVFREIMEQRSGYIGAVLEKAENSSEFKKTTSNHSSHTEPTVKGMNKNDFGLYDIGTLGRVVNITPNSTERFQVVVNFQSRFFIKEVWRKDPAFIARIDPLTDMQEEDITSRKDKDTLKGYVAALMVKVKELIKLNSFFSEELKMLVSRYSSQSLSMFLSLLSSLLTAPKSEELQKLLETNNLIDKILMLLDNLHREVEVFKVKDKINQQIEEKVSGQQREYFLREQLKYIEKELGIGGNEKDLTLKKIEEQIETLPLSAEARKVATAEFEKLRLYDPKSAEYGVVKNYLDWILSLPWSNSREPFDPDLDKARKMLDQHHYGLDKIKSALLEFLAVQKLHQKATGSILCFVGPPGVGKTSMGKSLAEVMGRKFYRFSVGGMRDEAEIKGHRRTYVGAMPGKIIQALKNLGSHNPVILIDEIDKLMVSYQGDPSAALLEVLDPEQNKDFLDHYLDIRFDLSEVFFITTANELSTIPEPLRDRMEIVTLSSYTTTEKKNIAKKHLIPRQREYCGLKAGDFNFSSDALEELIEYYTAEAGVRGLERAIRHLFRKVAFEKSQKTSKHVKYKKSSKTLKPTKSNKTTFSPVNINIKFIETHLGEYRVKDSFRHTKEIPGIVCGLAWTPLGGSTLYIEAIVVSAQATPALKLTGKLGEVMGESAQIAYNYVRSWFNQNTFSSKSKKLNQKENEFSQDFFADKLIHLHVPAGAIPKDGPSAGITMALALTSLALGKAVPVHFAMTGELTLSGRVLPIGGLKEKLIAAKKNGKKHIIIPKENAFDIAKIDPIYLKGIKIDYVDHFSEVLKITLGIKV